MVMGAEVGVRLPDARECRGLLAAAGSRDGGMEQLLPQSLHGASPQRGQQPDTRLLAFRTVRG